VTKLVFIAAPIGALAIYVLWRAVRGRPLSRFALNVVVALYLLSYLLVTAGLGIFWVARMDLPAFDLHYLFGYCVVVLAALHVALQLRILSAWIRKVSPKRLLERDGSAFRPAVRLTAGAAVALALLVPIAILVAGRPRGEPARLRASVPAPEQSSDPGATIPRIFIETRGERISAIDYMHEQSSYSRSGLMRSVPVVTRRPDDTKAYPGAARLALPLPRSRAGISLGAALVQRASHSGQGAPAEARIVPAGPTGAMPLAALAEMLHYSAGITSNKAESAGLSLRAAASSGALFPTDVYVAARAVQGLNPGLYYYHPREHALFELGGGGALLDRIGESLARPERDAPVSFVLGVTFDRTVHKYNVRSYRYVALDTGHLATNLALSAVALGWPCRLEPNFDDEALSRALSADAEHEGPLAVVSCGGPAPGRETASRAFPAAEPVALPERADQSELTRLSHRLTSWKLDRGTSRRPAPLLPAAETAIVEGYEEAERDVFEAIASRRSYREFAADALEHDELRAILRDSVDLSPRVRGGELVDLYLVVRAVAGLEPGVYRRAAGERLELVLAGDRSAQIESAGLSQELLGRAAVVLVWTLSRSAGEIDGTRDYRHAGLEAGLAGENAYLSATARGLGICGVGAFYDDEVNALLAHGGVRPRALYLQGVGRR
jgi:SagB-type dehydrogenase family enzyme